MHAIFPRPQLDAYLQAGRTERELATRQARAALNKPGMRPVPRQGGGGGAGPSAAASALGPLQQLEARGGFAAGQGKLQVHLGPPGDDGDGEEAGEAVFGAPGGMGAPAAGGAGPSRRPYKRRPRPKAEAGDGADPNAPLGPPKLLLALFPWQEAVTPTAGAAATATGEMDGGPLGADSVGAVAGSPSPGGGSGRAAAVPSAAARRTPHALPALAALDKPYMLVEAGQKLEALAAWVNAKLLRKNKALPELLCAGARPCKSWALLSNKALVAL